MPHKTTYGDEPPSLLTSRQKLDQLNRRWPNLPESVRAEIWHRAMWAVTRRWEFVIPEPLVLGGNYTVIGE